MKGGSCCRVRVARWNFRFLSKTGLDELYSEILWKEEPKTVIVLYAKYALILIDSFLSTTGHVKSCGNPPRLCGKAKYTF